MQTMDWIFAPRRVAVTLLFTLLVACTPSGTAAPTPVLPLNLTAYATVTRAVNPTATLRATEIPLPTPTPFPYAIQSGDTLSTIAARFGLTLDALLAANPGIVAEALTVGQSINIPAGGGSTQGEALPTPAPLDLTGVRCQGSGAGLYCLVPIQNPYPETLENVRVQVTLLDAAGQPVTSQESLLPLDILPAGRTLPAAAFFAAAPPSYTAQAQLISSIRLLPGDPRYVDVSLQNIFVSIDWDGRTAHVQGLVAVPEQAATVSSVSLVGVAYAADGSVVGFRRWDWSGSLPAGALQGFAFAVYSTGAAIERVEVVAEARP